MLDYSKAQTEKGIPLSLRPAFQEYKLEQLDPDKHAFTIIERALAYGGKEEIRWLFSRYGKRRIEAWVQTAGWRLLPRRRLQFWAVYFNLDNLPKRGGAWPY
ncbi:MAG TPA: hypothetical protein EYP41_13995 [Anaerolineae bacterium]|nr:hypothetical protein [Chloroflexota bacterium]HID53131.1 hypothetical protein [Anaerolineae bacterium]